MDTNSNPVEAFYDLLLKKMKIELKYITIRKMGYHDREYMSSDPPYDKVFICHCSLSHKYATTFYLSHVPMTVYIHHTYVMNQAMSVLQSFRELIENFSR